uniref:Phospholipase-like protein n=1 Tax=Tanacetum cinerariifolium TaxID=118510 RepID=A0A699GU06_TANCI|nr:phospholipase-like protein [Tanacetum cinerariifolium]
MVSCYFIQILLQNSTSLFYANGEKYATPWSDVDQIYCSDWSLSMIAKARMTMSGMIDMIKLFEIENERDFRVVRETYVTCQEFNVRYQERREQMIEMQPFLHMSTVLADSYNSLKELPDYELEKCRELPDYELEKCRELMKSITKTQLKVLKKISFIAKLRQMKAMNDPEEFYDALFCLRDDKRDDYNALMAVNNVIAEAKEKLNTKEAHLESLLNIMFDFKMTDDMPIMDEVVSKIHKNGYFEFNPLRTNELPDNYCVFEVNYDGVFNEYSLRCSLEEGLTIVKDASDEEMKSKLKSHEKRKLDACSMSPHELVEWEQQEAGSPYLRTPHLKPRRKGIEFPYGYIDVGDSSKHCDLVHENVVDNGHSLLNMDKERFSNNVVLDDVVTDTLAFTLPLILKKKCRNKVNVTTKTRCINNLNTMRLSVSLTILVKLASYT